MTARQSWTVGWMMGLLAMVSGAWAQEAATAADELKLGPGVSLTVYNQDFAVIKERREVQMQAGRQVFKFTDVAAQIDPTSVYFVDLTDPQGTKVVEQNFEFDLVNADKLLQKYIDRPIRIVTQDGSLIAGKLMSFDGAQIVLATDDGQIQMVPRARNVKDIQFSELPAGLLTRPTLVWMLDAGKAGNHLLKTAYISGGFDWRADYTLSLAADEKTVGLSGWVTVTNNSGSRYQKAQVKLMAGEVHRVLPPAPRQMQFARAAGGMAEKAAQPQVEEKAFAEYHLYTVTRNVDLNDRQTKQIEFMDRADIPVTKAYIWRSGTNPWLEQKTTHVDVEIRFRNDEKSNLGIPLPAGVVREYKRDATGDLLMLGQTNIEHTPKDEDLKFAMGKAFDVVAERKAVDFRRPAARVIEEDVQLTVRNQKTEPITVTIEERMWRYPQWQLLKQSAESTKPEVQTAKWVVELPANSAKTITYTVRYWW